MIAKDRDVIGCYAGAGSLYLYALVPADADSEDRCRGIDDTPLFRIASGGVAMVASEVSQATIRPERRHIAASQAVQRALLDSGDVLPMAFGTLAADRATVMRLLDMRRGEFAALLARISGKVEMGVRVVLGDGDVFRAVVEREPALKDLRDRTFRGPRRPSRDQLIRTGQMFEAGLDRFRAEVMDKVADALRRHPVEIERMPPRREGEMANLACLVPRAEVPGFAHWLAEAADGFGQEFVFDFNGPWPPHNFGALRLDD